MASGSNGGGLSGVVAVGASAGGVEALTEFAARTARGSPVRGSGGLARAGQRAQCAGTDHRPQRAAARPPRDRRRPTDNRYRPAINALFRSVALASGPRAVGVLLSGVLDDGVLGMAAIRSRGGTTIAQRVDDALFPAMPQNAVNFGAVDHQRSAADLGALLTELAHREIREEQMEPDRGMELENRIAMGSRFHTVFDADALGRPSGYTARTARDC